MIDDLNLFWAREFNDVEPRAHDLKHEFGNRWVRYHALPESKRYPEEKREYIEIYRRHNTVLQELLGNEAIILVIVPEYSESNLPRKPESALEDLFPYTVPWRSLEEHEEDDRLVFYTHLHVAKIVFTGSELNHLFRMVADDKVGNILLVSLGENLIFHPYDGGADVVLSTDAERDQLKEKYSEWLSLHPDGF